MTQDFSGFGLLARRLINKVGRPFGINPFPRSFPNQLSETIGRQAVFERVFATNFWASDQSRSGVGSEKAFTERYQNELLQLIERYGFARIFDAPCGDLNWMPDVIAATGVRYVGGDISPGVVKLVQQRHPDLDVRVFDVCEDVFPEADVWHCRDCLFHLSFADIRQALENYASSGIPYALLTTHRARWHRNLDVTTGGFRYLDLEREPINLPRPLSYLRDFTVGRDFPRYVGLWSRQAILRALEAD